MKKSTKRDIAITCSVLALGCFLMAAGWGMGGSLTPGQNISIGGSNGIHMGSDGLFVGGRNGIYVGPNGISVGGRNGIYVGPEGIRIGASYTSDPESTEQAWIFPGSENDWGTIVQETGDASVQSIEMEAFDCVEVNIDLGDITVVQDGPGYFVTFQNNVEEYELSYKLDGSTLSIESKGERAVHWSTVNAKASVVIIIPYGSGLKDIDLHTDLGDIIVGQIERPVPTATLNTNLGDVTWDGSTVKELNAHSSLGNVTMMLPNLEKVGYEISTSLGEIIVDNEVMTKENVNYKPKNAESYVRANSDLGDIYLGAY